MKSDLDEDEEKDAKEINKIEEECFSKTELEEFAFETYKILLRGLPKRYAFSVCIYYYKFFSFFFRVERWKWME